MDTLKTLRDDSLDPQGGLRLGCPVTTGARSIVEPGEDHQRHVLGNVAQSCVVNALDRTVKSRCKTTLSRLLLQ
ncbi:hypothetical protein D3C81_1757720 [compost metagenome]